MRPPEAIEINGEKWHVVAVTQNFTRAFAYSNGTPGRTMIEMQLTLVRYDDPVENFLPDNWTALIADD